MTSVLSVIVFMRSYEALQGNDNIAYAARVFSEVEYRKAHNNNRTIEWQCSRCFDFVPDTENS